jgi:hypothetical protein
MFRSAEQREHCRSSSLDKVVYVNSSFAENRAERALRHVSGMVRKGDLSTRLGMASDFVAAGTGTIELETKRSETAGNFPVGKSCEASHLRDRNRDQKFALRPNLAPEYRGEGIAVFPTRFHDFSSETLSDFDRFGDAAAFGHQSRNIRAGTQIAAILQILDANPNGHFLDFCEVLLPLHGRFLRREL